MSSSFDHVPVVDVHKDNFQEVWSSLLLSIKTATFVAIDTELSGLGERKLMMAKEIESRYKGTVETAKSRSIISLGLSCFRLINIATKPGPSSSVDHDIDQDKNGDTNKPEQNPQSWRFLVQTFNIVTLCQEDYIVEPAALQFLVGHGFDFNRQYEKGIPYYRGCDRNGNQDKISIRQLFLELVKSEVPVIFHNALVDLMFLYQNLYTNLPASSASFLADLSEMFPNGIFDTKYITDFVHRMPASYLEYVFRKCQRENAQNSSNNRSCAELAFPTYPDTNPNINRCYCQLPDPMADQTSDQRMHEMLKESVCPIYAAHGNCKSGQSCPKSHNVDLILDLDYLIATKKSRKRKRRKENQSNGEKENDQISIECEDEQSFNATDTVEVNKSYDSAELESHESSKSHDLRDNQSGSRSKAGGHRAGFDAFMTGFIMSVYISNYAVSKGNMDLKNLGIDNLKNNIYLSGKDVPLIVVKSAFAKTSKEHRTKFDKLISRESSNIV